MTMSKDKQHYQKDKGFTLIELLAVLIVLISVGGIMFGVLFASLRGSTRATVLTDVQDNGDYAITEMSRVIRFAQAVVSPESCIVGPTPTPIATSSVTLQTVDHSSITYTCPEDAEGTIASNGASLVDTQMVEVTSCTFTCSQTSLYESPTIGISFSLNKKDATSLLENNAPLMFQTSVTLRNKIQ